MKDNFLQNSQNYAQFRPSYPDEVFTFLESILKGMKLLLVGLFFTAKRRRKRGFSVLL